MTVFMLKSLRLATHYFDTKWTYKKDGDLPATALFFENFVTI